MKAAGSILKNLKVARDNLANQNNKCEYICEALGWPDRGTEKHDAIRFLVEKYGMDLGGDWFDTGLPESYETPVKINKRVRVAFLDKVIAAESEQC